MLRTRWQEWAIALIGAWLIVSPWLVGTGWSSPFSWDVSACGVAVMFLAAWVLGDAHGVLPARGRAAGDLRGDRPELGVPDESAHLAGLSPPLQTGPEIEAPDFHVQTPGETTKG